MFALLAPLFFCSASQVSAQTPAATLQVAPQSIEDLIPANAQAVVRIASIERLRAVVMPVVRVFDAEAPPVDPLAMLGAEMELEAPWDEVDTTRPVLMTLALDDPHGPPAITLLCASKNSAAFPADGRIGGSGWKCRIVGEFVILETVPGSAVMPADAPLRAGLGGGDIVLRVDCKALMAEFGDEMLHTLETTADEAIANANTPEEGQVVQELIDGTRDSIASVEFLSFKVSQLGARTALSFELTSAAGSALLSVPKVDAAPLANLVRVIGNDAPFAVVAAFDFAPFAARIQEWTRALTAEMKEVQGIKMDAFMQDWSGMYSAMGACSVTDFRLDDSGMSVSYALQPNDAKAFMDAHVASMSVMNIEGPTAIKVSGIDVQRYTMNVRAFVESTMGEQATELPPKFDEFMRKLFGAESLPVSYATIGRSLLFSMGTEAGVKAGLERLTAQAPSQAASELLSTLGTMNPGLAMRVDPARLMDGIMGFARNIKEDIEPLDEELHAALVACPPVFMALGLEERTWKLSFDLDLPHVVDVFQKIPPSVTMAEEFDPIRSELEFELSNLTYALDSYAAGHDGAYPDSLIALLTKSPEGFEYITEAGELIDPWNRPYLYTAPTQEGELVRVHTLGADGQPGGVGDDRDLDLATLEAESRAPDGADEIEEH